MGVRPAVLKDQGFIRLFSILAGKPLQCNCHDEGKMSSRVPFCSVAGLLTSSAAFGTSPALPTTTYRKFDRLPRVQSVLEYFKASNSVMSRPNEARTVSSDSLMSTTSQTMDRPRRILDERRRRFPREFPVKNPPAEPRAAEVFMTRSILSLRAYTGPPSVREAALKLAKLPIIALNSHNPPAERAFGLSHRRYAHTHRVW